MIVPSVTEDEILKSFEVTEGKEFVLTAGTIAWRIWQMRGGEGNYDDPISQPEPRVPLVREHHVRKTLPDLLAHGKIGTVTDANREDYGNEVRYFGQGNPRTRATYYGRTPYLEEARRRKVDSNRRLAAAVSAAANLHNHDHILTSVRTDTSGMVVLRLTPEQAVALHAIITNAAGQTR